MKHFKRVAFILIGLIVTICLSGFGYVYFKLNKMYVKDEVVKKEITIAHKSLAMS